MKVLEENVGDDFYVLGQANVSLKGRQVENNTFGHIKIKKLCLSEDTIKTMKGPNTEQVTMISTRRSNKNSYLEDKKQKRND